MNHAVYPGSFDPITLGHVDIIRRLRPMFGKFTVLISHHPSKKTLFSTAERERMTREALRGIDNVGVEIYEGLTVEYLKSVGARVIIRGLRAVTDFEYELVMANMNKKLAPEIETMIVFASPEFYYVASSTVKEVALHGGSVKGLVPGNVEKALRRMQKSSSKSAAELRPGRKKTSAGKRKALERRKRS